MEKNSNNTPQQEDNNENKKPKKSWFERNLWVIATCTALFLLRFCSQVANH